MACLTLEAAPVEPVVLEVAAVTEAGLDVSATLLELSALPVGVAELSVAAVDQAALTVGNACAVSDGTLSVEAMLIAMGVKPSTTALLIVKALTGTTLQVTPLTTAALDAQPLVTASLVADPVLAALAVETTEQAMLIVGEVCSVNSGTLVVLASIEGPLLTRTGGYILLNPATNPPD